MDYFEVRIYLCWVSVDFSCQIHLSASLICSQGTDAKLIAIQTVDAENFQGSEIARAWANVILQAKTKVHNMSNQHNFFEIISFFYMPTRAPESFVVYYAVSNNHARRMCAIRNPSILFIPWFPHQVGLQCGHSLTLSKNSSAVSRSLKCFNLFNKSSLKWLPRLHKILKQMIGRSHALVTGVVTQ